LITATGARPHGTTLVPDGIPGFRQLLPLATQGVRLIAPELPALPRNGAPTIVARHDQPLPIAWTAPRNAIGRVTVRLYHTPITTLTADVSAECTFDPAAGRAEVPAAVMGLFPVERSHPRSGPPYTTFEVAMTSRRPAGVGEIELISDTEVAAGARTDVLSFVQLR
jgi:hypothetical protein